MQTLNSAVLQQVDMMLQCEFVGVDAVHFSHLALSVVFHLRNEIYDLHWVRVILRASTCIHVILVCTPNAVKPFNVVLTLLLNQPVVILTTSAQCNNSASQMPAQRDYSLTGCLQPNESIKQGWCHP